MKLCLSRTDVFLEKVSNTGLDGVTGGSAQLKNDIQRCLEILLGSLVHHVCLECQLQGGRYGSTITTQCLNARVVVLGVAVFASRPVASHNAN